MPTLATLCITGKLYNVMVKTIFYVTIIWVAFINDYLHDVQLPTFHVIRQTFLTSYSSLYTSQPHQAHTCYSHAQAHTKDCMIFAQCWIIPFLKDYYCIYLVKWINTEVFFSCNVNIFTVSNTILYSLRIELETYFFF